MVQYTLHLSLAVVLVFLPLSVQSSEAEPVPSWERLSDMPVGVLAAAVSVSGEFAVLTGGITQIGLATNLVQIFDLHKFSWRMPPQYLQMARAGHAQVTLTDGRILVVGGRGIGKQLADGLSAAEIFDPLEGSSTSVTPLPRRVPIPTAHVLSDGRVIVIGQRSAFVFDPSTTIWRPRIRLHQVRRGHASILLPGGAVLVAGGEGQRSFELIDEQQQESRLLSVKLPLALDDLRMVALSDRRVWVIGGQDTWSGDTTNRTWFVDVEDAESATIRAGPVLGVPQGLADHCVVRLGSRIIVAGGESQRQGVDTELSYACMLDTRTLEMGSLPRLFLPHDDSVAVATPTGVIIFGGTFADSSILGRRLPMAGQHVEYLKLPSEVSEER